MIKYSLQCERDHAFDSWFRDSSAFDDLLAARQVTCPSCGSAQLRKALMAPSVVTTRRKAEVPGPVVEPPQAVALVDDRARKLRDMVRDLHRVMTENADDVGRAFPEEARRIHEGQTPPRSIYGQASREEVSALIEDGIPLLPVPTLPDEKN